MTPDLGELAPDFVLPDADGQMQSLGELAGEGPLVLLFYRGHW